MLNKNFNSITPTLTSISKEIDTIFKPKFLTIHINRVDLVREQNGGNQTPLSKFIISFSVKV